MSDVHCQIISHFKFASSEPGCHIDTSENCKPWQDDKKHIFLENLDQDKILLINSLLNETTPEHPDARTSINNIVSLTGECLTESAKNTFGTFKHRSKNQTKKATIKKPWFDDKCKTARTHYNTNRRSY